MPAPGASAACCRTPWEASPLLSLQVQLSAHPPLRRHVQFSHRSTCHQAVNRHVPPALPCTPVPAARRRCCSSRSPPAADARTRIHPTSCALGAEMRRRSEPLITSSSSSFPPPPLLAGSLCPEVRSCGCRHTAAAVPGCPRGLWVPGGGTAASRGGADTQTNVTAVSK